MHIREFKNNALNVSSCHTYGDQWCERCSYQGRRDKAVKSRPYPAIALMWLILTVY